MMNKERELLKRALVILETANTLETLVLGSLKLEDDIRAYLASEPEDAPVAWLKGVTICPEVGYDYTLTEQHPKDLGWTPLYTRPAPERKPIPIDQIDKTYEDNFYLDGYFAFDAGVRFAERHHGIGEKDETAQA